MAISSINTDVLRGNVTTIILGSLWNQDKYGYEILKEIEDKSDGHFKIKQPTLYNQLKRLEKQGLISSYEGDPNDTGGGQRCYYKLTDEGKAFLTKERSEYEYSRTILDKLVSDDEYDFGKPAPFDTDKLRPYSLKDDSDKEKVVVKEKVVEKVVEKKVYLDMYGNEITEEEAADLRNQQEEAFSNAQPAKTLDELFQDLEQKHVQPQIQPQVEQPVKEEEPEEQPFWVSDNVQIPVTEPTPNYYSSTLEPDPNSIPESTLEELFAQIEQKHQAQESQKAEDNALEQAQEEERNNELNAEQMRQQSLFDLKEEQLRKEEEDLRARQEEFNRSQYEYNEQNDEYIVNAYETSEPDKATLNKRTDDFEFNKNDVDYKDFFASIAPTVQDTPLPQPKEEQPQSSFEGDLRARLYRQGFKIRPYNKGNSSEYYTFNFIHANRINRDVGLCTMGLYILELAIMWLSMMDVVSYKYFVPVLLIGILGCLAPTVIYTLNPSRRTRAEFSFKRSIINRSMIFVECLVIAVLIGVFGFNASLVNLGVLYETIIIPLILFTCFPASSLIYWLLFRSKKYHIA